jgi:hypothetical protein
MFIQNSKVPRGDGESAGPRTRFPPRRSPSGAGDPGPRRWNEARFRRAEFNT